MHKVFLQYVWERWTFSPYLLIVHTILVACKFCIRIFFFEKARNGLMLLWSVYIFVLTFLQMLRLILQSCCNASRPTLYSSGFCQGLEHLRLRLNTAVLQYLLMLFSFPWRLVLMDACPDRLGDSRSVSLSIVMLYTLDSVSLLVKFEAKNKF